MVALKPLARAVAHWETRSYMSTWEHLGGKEKSYLHCAKYSEVRIGEMREGALLVHVYINR